MIVLKLQINYDLLSKIFETNTGISLKKSSEFVILSTSISTIFEVVSGLIISSPPEEHLKRILGYFIIHSVNTTIASLALSKIVKILSSIELKRLSNSLKHMNVNTNEELLKDSYKYKTEYEVIHDESLFPKIEQRKYIMVPAYENGEEQEVSILQEHIIGSKKYILSRGEPKKVLKLSFNPM